MFEPFPRLQVDLTETLCHLGPHSSTRPSGSRNGYLRVLAREFYDRRAASTIGLLYDLASRYVIAERPSWFYAAVCAVKLVAPIQASPVDPADALDVRPFGVGERLRRAINSAVPADQKSACREHFWPQQVAANIESGISPAIFGV